MKSVLYKSCLALALSLGAALPVLAHGVIERADPPVGGAVASAPGLVRLWFSEPVDPGLSRIEVYPVGSAGRIDLGDLRLQPDGALVISLRPGLPSGAYLVNWRAFTPGDGHESSGAYSFGVGVPAQPTETVAAERTPVADLARFLTLSGQCLFLGLAVFRWLIRLEDDVGFCRSLFWPTQAVRVGLGLGLLGALYSQTSALGVPVWLVLGTRWGLAWLARLAMSAVVIWRADALIRGREVNAALLSGTFLLMTASLTSHSAAQSGLLGAAVDALHQASASVWTGGVLATAIALARGERTFLPRFGVLATAAIGGLAASGLWLAGGQVGSWTALLFTEYGRALSAKLAVVAVAFGLGAYNAFAAFQKTPAAGARPGSRLPLLEALAGVGVLLSAAVLTNLPPAYSQLTDGAPARVTRVKPAGEWMVTLALSPARTGPNLAEVQLADGAGQPVLGRQVRLQFVPVDIPGAGAIASDLALEEVGQGLYSAAGTNLTRAGEWQVLLAVDEARFLNFDFVLGPDGVVRPSGEPFDEPVRLVDWLNRYAPAAGLALLLLGAAAWSGLAWLSLRATAEPQIRLAMWLAPGLLLAGALWLWIKLLT